jgi:hypothetical protein
MEAPGNNGTPHGAEFRQGTELAEGDLGSQG